MREGVREEARSVRDVCHVCAVHRDRASDCVDVHAQGSSLRKNKKHLARHVGAQCRAFVWERTLVSGLRWHSEKEVVFLSFPMSLKERSRRSSQWNR